MRRDEIDVEPFKARVLALGLTPTARRLDWFDSKGRPDTQRVARTFGIKPYQRSGRPGRLLRKAITLPVADHACDALNLERWEVGL